MSQTLFLMLFESIESSISNLDRVDKGEPLKSMNLLQDDSHVVIELFGEIMRNFKLLQWDRLGELLQNFSEIGGLKSGIQHDFVALRERQIQFMGVIVKNVLESLCFTLIEVLNVQDKVVA